jgi:hypothetical protein
MTAALVRFSKFPLPSVVDAMVRDKLPDREPPGNGLARTRPGSLRMRPRSRAVRAVLAELGAAGPRGSLSAARTGGYILGG